MSGRAEIIEAAMDALADAIRRGLPSAHRHATAAQIAAALRAMHASDPARTVEEWIKELEE